MGTTEGGGERERVRKRDGEGGEGGGEGGGLREGTDRELHGSLSFRHSLPTRQSHRLAPSHRSRGEA